MVVFIKGDLFCHAWPRNVCASPYQTVGHQTECVFVGRSVSCKMGYQSRRNGGVALGVDLDNPPIVNRGKALLSKSAPKKGGVKEKRTAPTR